MGARVVLKDAAGNLIDVSSDDMTFDLVVARARELLEYLRDGRRAEPLSPLSPPPLPPAGSPLDTTSVLAPVLLPPPPPPAPQLVQSQYFPGAQPGAVPRHANDVGRTGLHH